MDFSDRNLTGAVLWDCRLRAARFDRCRMSLAILLRADATAASFAGADLKGADLTGAVMRRADLHDADLQVQVVHLAGRHDARMAGAGCRHPQVQRCRFTGAWSLSACWLGTRISPARKATRRLLAKLKG